MRNLTFRDFNEQTDRLKVITFVGRKGSRPNISDISEKLEIPQIKKDCKVWVDADDHIKGVVLVDDYQNFCVDVVDEMDFASVLDEALPRALDIALKNFDERALDTCEFSDSPRLPILKHKGFIETGLRSFRYQFIPATESINVEVPAGFIVRPLQGESEISVWLDLHMAAHPDGQLDEEYRRAMMAVPDYRQDLDYVMVSPEGALVAYCVGTMERQPDGSFVGYTDPVAVHPDWHGKGLGKAIMRFCMRHLIDEGASLIEVMTSSENLPMQRLAESVGFSLVEENIWLRLEMYMA